MNVLLIQKYQLDGVCNFVVDRKDRVKTDICLIISVPCFLLSREERIRLATSGQQNEGFRL